MMQGEDFNKSQSNSSNTQNSILSWALLPYENENEALKVISGYERDLSKIIERAFQSKSASNADSGSSCEVQNYFLNHSTDDALTENEDENVQENEPANRITSEPLFLVKWREMSFV